MHRLLNLNKSLNQVFNLFLLTSCQSKQKKGHIDPNHECHNDTEVLLYSSYRALLILPAIVISKLFVSSFGVRFSVKLFAKNTIFKLFVLVVISNCKAGYFQKRRFFFCFRGNTRPLVECVNRFHLSTRKS